ncbi:hypothetical protein [Microbacterium sp.]|uniref:hypothetical protein n=1 Tax=Microbacterium sp. TaxID=51671 RepID=UPI00262E61C1|nr:hypothetical protein [Microbacterium sp.]
MSIERIRAELTAEQVALLEEHGQPITPAHSSTKHRRLARAKRPFPVIARSGRHYREANGRRYGELPAGTDQRQADARYWRVGAAVRDACEPMTVSVGGTVQRIYEVRGWYQEPGQTKWTADLGRLLTDEDLDRDYPDYPYRYGNECKTSGGGAYRPEYY